MTYDPSGDTGSAVTSSGTRHAMEHGPQARLLGSIETGYFGLTRSAQNSVCSGSELLHPLGEGREPIEQKALAPIGAPGTGVSLRQQEFQ